MLRIGHGYDVHRLVEGRKLILGGVEIENDGIGLLGHSDADVAIHALLEEITPYVNSYLAIANAGVELMNAYDYALTGDINNTLTSLSTQRAYLDESSTYKIRKLNNKVEEAFSTMDVYLKKRWDLIPNIVETVKGYAKHEKSTLEEVINLRNSSYDKMNTNDKVETNNKLSQGISKLMAIAEAYPELKANENFKDLSNQLTKVEDDIANARKYYNGTVRIFNDKVQMFPSNIIASIFGYKVKNMFEANEFERENVKVKL